MSTRTALVAGATGLVGGLCVQLLLQDESYSRVTILVRRPTPLAHHKLNSIVVDFDNLQSVSDQIRADDIFLCLGTTNAETADRGKYHKIDVEYPARIAAIAKANGASRVCLVSSLGANPNSGQWYIRYKGEVEEEIKRLGFDSVNIFRPSFIAGRLQNQRLKEKLALATMRFWSFLFFGASRRFLPLDASLIAQSMIKAAKEGPVGCHAYNRIDMLKMLGQKP